MGRDAGVGSDRFTWHRADRLLRGRGPGCHRPCRDCAEEAAARLRVGGPTRPEPRRFPSKDFIELLGAHVGNLGSGGPLGLPLLGCRQQLLKLGNPVEAIGAGAALIHRGSDRPWPRATSSDRPDSRDRPRPAGVEARTSNVQAPCRCRPLGARSAAATHYPSTSPSNRLTLASRSLPSINLATNCSKTASLLASPAATSPRRASRYSRARLRA